MKIKKIPNFFLGIDVIKYYNHELKRHESLKDRFFMGMLMASRIGMKAYMWYHGIEQAYTLFTPQDDTNGIRIFTLGVIGFLDIILSNGESKNMPGKYPQDISDIVENKKDTYELNEKKKLPIYKKDQLN